MSFLIQRAPLINLVLLNKNEEYEAYDLLYKSYAFVIDEFINDKTDEFQNSEMPVKQF